MTEDTARRPPYSEEAERGVLGSILQDWENIPDRCVEKHLVADDFYMPAHQVIYRAMGMLMGNERPIDTLSVAEYLKTQKQLEKIGGAITLDRLIDATPTTAHSDHYIDIVKSKSLGRKIIRNAYDTLKAAHDNDDMEMVRSVAEAAFASMERNTSAKTIESVIKQMILDIESGMRGDPPEIGISTGYHIMDALSPGGMRNGSPYWLSGKPKAGKTSLKCNILERALLAGRVVADLSLEMSMEEEIKKLTGIHCDRDITKLILGEGGEIMPHKLIPFTEMLKTKQFHIADQSVVRDVREFRSWCRRMVTKFGVELITVDYVQKLGIEGSDRMKIEEQTAKQVDCVTSTAGILNVPILGVVEENDQGGVRGSQRGDYASAGHWSLRKTDPNFHAEAPDFKTSLSLKGRVGRYGPSGDTNKLMLFAGTGLITEEVPNETQKEFA